MFGSLIRRKTPEEPGNGGDAAFESTTVSLSTAVPRPIERRRGERVSAMLRLGKLTGENFNAAPLARTISAVPGRSLSFFMSHGLPSHVNGFDLYCGKMLAVSTLSAVVFTPFLFEH